MRKVGADGAPVVTRAGGTSGSVNGPMETMYTLAAPDAAAKRIARLAVSTRFVLLKRMDKLEVDNVLQVKGAQRLLGGFRVVVNDVNKVTDGRFAFDISTFQDGRSAADWDLFRALLDRHGAKLVDAEGRTLSFSGGSSSYQQGQLKMNNTVTTGRDGNATGEPAKLVWEFPEEVEQVSVPLVFRDVPLP
jgi:hypothetical protein